MTLILGMSKSEGLYLSADFRVTQYATGRLIDDTAAKLLTVEFPPLGDGSRALMAFTGLARFRDGLSIGDWLIQTMRGESEYPDQAFAHLKARLNRDVAPLRQPLIVNVLVIEGSEGQRRLFGGFTNQRLNRQGQRIELLNQFEYVMQELSGPFIFVNGSGALEVARSHLQQTQKQLDVRPRRADDHMKLLASINRRVASTVPTVSPACHVAFIPAHHPKPGPGDPKFGPRSRSFTLTGESAPLVMPHLFGGIDLTPMMRDTMERFAAMKEGREPPPEVEVDEMNRRLRRRT